VTARSLQVSSLNYFYSVCNLLELLLKAKLPKIASIVYFNDLKLLVATYKMYVQNYEFLFEHH